MTFRQWWGSVWNPSDKKEKSALASRKFLALMLVAGVVVASAYIIVAALHIYSSSIVEKGLEVLQNVAIAYFSVNVVEKVVDVYNKMKNGGEV